MSDKIEVIHIGYDEKKEIRLAMSNGLSIQADDTIMDIKRKIALTHRNDITVDEIYLFGKIKKKEDPEKIFTLFTTKNLRPSSSIPYSDIKILEHNYEGKINLKIRKTAFLYKDFKGLYDWKNIKTEKTFGHKIFYKNDYPIVVNPYKLIQGDLTNFDKNLFTHNENNQIIYDENNTLLFQQGNLSVNNIYYVCAKEIFNVIERNKDIIPRVADFYRYILQVYFPKLHYDKQIHTREQLNDIKESNDLKSYEISYKNIDKFYTNKHKKTHKGQISSINFTMHPQSKIHIPMDLLFKIFHSNIDIPFIKYNPGRNRENIFRFYTKNYITDNNTKLPYLYVEDNKRYYKIQRIDRALAPNNSLGFYIELEDKLSPILYCEFYPNGNINIRIDDCSIDYDDLIIILKKGINELLINPINKFIKKSGFSYALFENLNTSVEIKYIRYKFQFELLKKNNFTLNNWSRALKEIYVTNNKNFKTKNQIDFQYRKVGSYKVMDAIDKFILNYKRVEMEEDDNVLIDLLLTNFSKKIKTKGDAVQIIENYNSETRFNLSVYANKKIGITDNPGFKGLLVKKFKQCEIIYEDIDDYNYLKHIDIYTSFLIENLLLKGRKGRNETLKEFELGKALPQLNMAQNENVIVAVAMEEQEQSVLDTGYDGSQGESESQELEEDENNKFQEDNADDYEDESDSDEDDDEDGSDDDAWGSQGGGKDDNEDKKRYDSSSSDDEVRANLNDIELRGVNNYFINKIKRYQPEIVSKNSAGNTLSFAKSCQTNAGKTPVILTKDQKDAIDEADKISGTRSYDEFLETEDSKYHYICPRFWCFSDPESGAPDGRSLSVKQINEGACGGWDALIPKGSKTASNEKRIYEFTDAKSHEGVVGNNLVYKQHYPGYQQKKLKGKDGVKDICVPCCYRQPSGEYKPEDWEEDKYDDGEYKSAPLNFKRGEDGSLPNPKYNSKEKVPQMKNGVPTGVRKPGYNFDSYIKEYRRTRSKPSKKRATVKKECSPQSNEEEDNKPIDQMVRPIIESFPLKSGNLGYLQLALQKFFNYNSVKKDWITTKNSKLRPDEWCLLRLGMDDDEAALYNSFLACIQNISDYDGKLISGDAKDDEGEKFSISKGLTVGDAEFRIKIQENFGFNDGGDYNKYEPSDEQMEKFTALNKGNLYHMFSDSKKGEEERDKIRRAMVNFLQFLTDSKDKKNAHEIFWDIVTAPKKNGGCYFEEGVNLIILKKPNDDIEDKIEVICPKNNFSKNLFDDSKKTIILYNEKDTYEPIYMYKRKHGSYWQVKKMFRIDDFRKCFPRTGVWKTIKALKDNFKKMCDEKTSMKHYDYNENKPLNKLLIKKGEEEYEIANINDLTYPVIKQLYNTQYQVVAVLINVGDEKEFALPCSPSAINLNIKRGEYETGIKNAILSKKDTEELLKEFGLYKEDSFVVDNGCIVGLRTNTNQVVLINPEGSNCEDKEKKDKMLMEYELDRKIMGNYPNQDEEREDIIKRIKLESNFYLMFRNLFKILINKKENGGRKQIINKILNNVSYSKSAKAREGGLNPKKEKKDYIMGYKKRMKEIVIMLNKVLSPHIEWFDKISIDVDIDDILNCLDMNQEQCKEIGGKDNDICTFSDSCRLYFPTTNLIYSEDAKIKNDIIYYKKLADELIRYKKIRDYVLKNDTFMNYDKVEYKINNDEIVIISNMFYKIYPNNIESIDHSEFIKNHSIYDNTNIKDGDIKKYSRELRMPDYSDEDDDVFSDEEEDVGVVEQKTTPPVKKEEAKKKEVKKKKEETKKKEVKKKVPKSVKLGTGLVILYDYIMSNNKDYKVSDFKEIKFVKLWKDRWVHCVKNVWSKKVTKKGVFDDWSGKFVDTLFWNGKSKTNKLPLPEDWKSSWDSDDNIFKKINVWENDQKGWYDNYTNNIIEGILETGAGVNLATTWRFAIDCLFRLILSDKGGKGDRVKDDDTMEMVLKKWTTPNVGCSGYYFAALKK